MPKYNYAFEKAIMILMAHIIISFIAGGIISVLTGHDAISLITLLVAITSIVSNLTLGPIRPTTLSGLKESLIVSMTFPIHLYRRIKAHIKDVDQTIFTVYINGIEVGEIEGYKYTKIVKSTFMNHYVILDQIVNVVEIACCSIKNLLIAIPILLFWAMVLLAAVKPEIFTEITKTVINDPASLVSLVVNYFTFLFITAAIFYLFSCVFRQKLPGFKNYIGKNITAEIRQYFNVTADGYVSLLPKSDLSGDTRLDAS